MSRYIDAEAIIDILEREIRTGELVSYDDMFDIIERFPTADVEPLRIGKWIKQRDMREFDFKFYKCSVCEKLNEIDTMVDDISNYHYCHNCGAKMEEEE